MRKQGTAVRLDSVPRTKSRTERSGQVSWWERERTGSEEEIIQAKPGNPEPLEIWESKEFHVETGSAAAHGSGAITTTREVRTGPGAGR
jgi:hypothetical protein